MYPDLTCLYKILQHILFQPWIFNEYKIDFIRDIIWKIIENNF